MRIHSLLSPRCEVRPSCVSGRGVFAASSLQAGELVAVWGGKVCTGAEVARLAKVYPHVETHAVCVCEGYFLTNENLFEFDDSELLNHSCEPNVGVQGQIVLVARRDIAAGEELTFDYDTTEIEQLAFDCQCGTPSCRGRIDGSAWKDPAFVDRNRQYLSWYIVELLSKRARTDAGHVRPGTGDADAAG